MSIIMLFFVLVDGGYGPWSEYATCSKSCGIGTKARRRECDNPKRKFNGRDCSRLGSAIEISACNLKPCPGNLVGHAIFLLFLMLQFIKIHRSNALF